MYNYPVFKTKKRKKRE